MIKENEEKKRERENENGEMGGERGGTCVALTSRIRMFHTIRGIVGESGKWWKTGNNDFGPAVRARNRGTPISARSQATCHTVYSFLQHAYLRTHIKKKDSRLANLTDPNEKVPTCLSINQKL